jgi:hypothetical protein
MKRFADLYMRLDATTGSNAKLEAMQAFFRDADPADAAWAVYFLAGGRPRQLVATKTLRRLALEASGYPEWLLEESYQAVGDLAETVALLLSRRRRMRGTSASRNGSRTACCLCAASSPTWRSSGCNRCSPRSTARPSSSASS